jgi:hypothetical protein
VLETVRAIATTLHHDTGFDFYILDTTYSHALYFTSSIRAHPIICFLFDSRQANVLVVTIIPLEVTAVSNKEFSDTFRVILNTNQIGSQERYPAISMDDPDSIIKLRMVLQKANEMVKLS